MISTRKLSTFRKKHEFNLLGGFIDALALKAFRLRAVRSIARRLSYDRRPERWIFVVGCYNSGTKILTRMIASHPAVSSLPQEGRFFTDAFPDVQAGGWRRMMYARRDLWSMSDHEPSKTAARAVRDWSLLWKGRGDAFVEKSICHTTRMPWLDDAFTENGRRPVFIGIARDGYSSAASVRDIGVPEGAAKVEFPERYSIEIAAKQWACMNETMLDDSNRVENFLLVRMEDLVDDPVKVLDEVFRFAGLDVPSLRFSEEVLEIGRSKIRIQSGRNDARKLNLTKDDRDAMRGVVEPVMKRLNYR